MGFSLEYPAATTPEEQVELAMADSRLGARITVGMVFLVKLYLPGSKIGATHVWNCGAVQVETADPVSGKVSLRRLDWQPFPGMEELARRTAAARLSRLAEEMKESSLPLHVYPVGSAILAGWPSGKEAIVWSQVPADRLQKDVSTLESVLAYWPEGVSWPG
jgi:hypothetical protein